MAYDEELADRVRAEIGPAKGLTEKKMFGGLAFLVDGNMAVCVSGKGGLMVRVDPDETAKLLEKTVATEMVMGNGPTKGWVRVAADDVRTKRQLGPWVKRGLTHARSLPKKSAKAKAAKKANA